MKEKDRSSHCCSNCVNVPKLADARKKIRNVVLTSVRTASISLNSVELSEFTSLRDIEKPPVLVALIGRLL